MLLSSFCHHFQTLLDPFLPAYIRNDCQERQESREAQNALFQRLVIMPCQWSQPQANPVRIGTTKSYGINVIWHCLAQQLY